MGLFLFYFIIITIYLFIFFFAPKISDKETRSLIYGYAPFSGSDGAVLDDSPFIYVSSHPSIYSPPRSFPAVLGGPLYYCTALFLHFFFLLFFFFNFFYDIIYVSYKTISTLSGLETTSLTFSHFIWNFGLFKQAFSLWRALLGPFCLRLAQLVISWWARPC